MTTPSQPDPRFPQGENSWGVPSYQPEMPSYPAGYQPAPPNPIDPVTGERRLSPEIKKWGIGEIFSKAWNIFGGSNALKIVGWELFLSLLIVIAVLPVTIAVVANLDSLTTMVERLEEETPQFDDLPLSAAFITIGVGVLILLVAGFIVTIISQNIMAGFSEKRFAFSEVRWFHRGWHIIGYLLLMGIVLSFIAMPLSFVGGLAFTALGAENDLLGELILFLAMIPVYIVSYLFIFAGYYVALGHSITNSITRSVKVAWKNILSLGVIYLVFIIITSSGLLPLYVALPITLLLSLWAIPALTSTVVGYDRGTLAESDNFS